MAFREVRVFEVREVLRLWLDGKGLRSVERLSQVDRKTVRRYVDAAEGLGLERDGDDAQLSDVFVGLVVERHGLRLSTSGSAALVYDVRARRRGSKGWILLGTPSPTVLGVLLKGYRTLLQCSVRTIRNREHVRNGRATPRRRQLSNVIVRTSLRKRSAVAPS